MSSLASAQPPRNRLGSSPVLLPLHPSSAMSSPHSLSLPPSLLSLSPSFPFSPLALPRFSSLSFSGFLLRRRRARIFFLELICRISSGSIGRSICLSLCPPAIKCISLRQFPSRPRRGSRPLILYGLHGLIVNPFRRQRQRDGTRTVAPGWLVYLRTVFPPSVKAKTNLRRRLKIAVFAVNLATSRTAMTSPFDRQRDKLE